MPFKQKLFDQAIWNVVSSIPPGRVVSYGEVARTGGYPHHARMVSKAMSRSDNPLPWYRVVRSNRTLAFDIGSKSYQRQKELLGQEGVQVIKGKVIPLESDDDQGLDELVWGPGDG